MRFYNVTAKRKRKLNGKAEQKKRKFPYLAGGHLHKATRKFLKFAKDRQMSSPSVNNEKPTYREGKKLQLYATFDFQCRIFRF